MYGPFEATDTGIVPRIQERNEGADGVLYCRLNKALYGCVQASNLWYYEKLKKFLQLQGFMHRDMDPCIFRKGKVYLLLIYIDNILLIVNCIPAGIGPL
jgi:hypothetical protein